MVRRAALLAIVLAASAAGAQERTLEGMGRIAIMGGYRWSPNAAFMKQAADLGHEVEGGMPGGPQFSASFGYSALEWVEATIDLIIGFESFKLRDLAPFTSTTYGALLGARIGKMDLPFRNLIPWIGFQLGPVLSFVTSKDTRSVEKLNTGYAINAGLTYRIGDRWAAGVDARYLFASGNVTDIGTVNAGGLWVSLSLTYFIPAGPKDPMGGML